MSRLEARLRRLEASGDLYCPYCGEARERLLAAILADLDAPARCPSCGRKVLTLEVVDRILAEADEEGGGASVEQAM